MTADATLGLYDAGKNISLKRKGKNVQVFLH